jgi:hypothetical protein
LLDRFLATESGTLGKWRERREEMAGEGGGGMLEVGRGMAEEERGEWQKKGGERWGREERRMRKWRVE